MNLFVLSWANLKSRPLNTLMSLVLLTLGVSIISLLLMLNRQLESSFTKNLKGIDLVVGAKGSPLQLILASVYHIDNPTGNIPLHEAEELAAHPLVEKTIPMAYGDFYQGYRILGTEVSYPAHYEVSVSQGKLWEAPFEVTLGAKVAQRLGLGIGDEFFGQHGSGQNAEVHEGEAYRVVGILEASGTVVDQLILTPIESVWQIHEEGHGEEEHGEEEHEEGEAAHADGEAHADEEGHTEDDEVHPESHAHEEERDITAMLVKFRSPMGMVMLPRQINEETSMQAALPAIEINRLFGLFAVGIDVLRAIAFAIILISGVSVFISLYNSLKERRYEMALMRSLGASRIQLFSLVVLEGLILAGLGFLLGIMISRMGLFIINRAVASGSHYDLQGNLFLVEEVYLFGATLLVGLLAAALPAWQAFRLNISRTLAEG
ncbi:MAG: ABC transporter permease [Bacteroidota bacterium]